MRARKYVVDKPKSLLTLEEPGKPLLFDVDRLLVAEVSEKCNIKALVASLKGKKEKEADAILDKFGKDLMHLTIELADHKYPERTGEVMNKVAKLTGVSFPHGFERYVEIALIGSRPQDRWNVVKATTKELIFQISTCAVQQAMKEQGLQYKGLPCQRMCLASFRAAAEKTGDAVTTDLRKTLPKDGMCEFVFTT